MYYSPLNKTIINNFIKGGLLFLGGAAVGATVALLLAPKTGDETRKQLSDLAEKAKKRAEEYSAKIKENLADANCTEQPVNTNTDGQ